MTVEANKELVLSWYDAFASGDFDRVGGMLHEDFRYYLPGNMPISGWRDRDGFLEGQAALAPLTTGPFTLRFGAVTAEGDRVLLEAEGDTEIAGGGRYTNVYIMALRVRDGKIAELKEFCDTLHVFQSFEAPVIRGEPKEREGHIAEVTKTVTINL